MAEGHVVHAYGVAPAVVLDVPEHKVVPPTGIAGTPVRLLALGELAVVVGDLPEKDFGEAAWREHAEDPDWLEPVARGHHEVLQAVAAATDVLPLRLPGIYRDDAELQGLLGGQEEPLTRRLQFVAGHDEWGVHVHLVEDTAEEAPEATSGRDYLMQRKAQVAGRDAAREERQRLLTEAYAGLAQVSTSSVLNRPQDRALSGREDPMLLNSAHLVAKEAQQQFFARADEVSRGLLEPAGMVMEISGPWPPYNFAAPAADGNGAADDPGPTEGR